MKFFSTFSGIEAASVAWEPLGFEAMGFSEVAEFPSAVLAHRFPKIKNYGNIEQFKEWGLEPGSAQILIGGSPCQSYSTAGLRKGLEDPRGNLALTFAAFANHLRPDWILWENVPGVLSSNGGKDFATFLLSMEIGGFVGAWRVLNASGFGVPQKRRRVFALFHRGKDASIPFKILFERGSNLRNRPESEREEDETPSAPSFDFDVETRTGVVAFKVRGGGVASGNKGGVIKPGSSGGTGALFNDRFAYTIATSQDQYLATFPINTFANHNRRDKENEKRIGMGIGDENSHQYAITTSYQHAIAFTNPLSPDALKESCVRKMTPVEAERIQGFPDNFTRIPWKGKSEEDCPDVRRYHAIGNSMAVPVVRWIGKRIQDFEKGVLE
jgi:DNA (cytosine-5)-methyltransferase 1